MLPSLSMLFITGAEEFLAGGRGSGIDVIGELFRFSDLLGKVQSSPRGIR